MHPRPRTISELLSACSDSERRVLEAGRAAIHGAVPEVVERFRPGWGLIGYNAPAYFAFIALDRGQVKLGFEYGVALADPLGLLEGDGRQVRYVTLRSEQDASRTELWELLREAAAFRRERGPSGSHRR